MTRRTIPGRLDCHALGILAGHVTDDDYRQRADAHRLDCGGLRAEAARLSREGLHARDIATALRLPIADVMTWIAEDGGRP